ncbi:MAG: bifunctional hydroxymethylpyrimidine kinase/phosphomethylpyrimidine kinase [Victivallaceae bacterium]|nr:bifunctional hydroxymethylpyrimidine kinase/phosphomethylpyrimidine kinase [Victivallaceae bacterium]
MKNDEREFYPAALTIAGSDSGGSAGIQADLRTFTASGIFGCSVITAVTAQNPREVTRIDPIQAAGVEAQLNAVLSTITIQAAKTGMLFNAEIIETTARCLTGRNFPLVIDPVMVSSSGTRLLEEAAVAVLADKLLPLASWVTPNIPEAELLLERQLKSHTELIEAAREFGERWNCSVILKAGHRDPDGGVAADIVYHENKIYELSSPRLSGRQAAHGTGCTLSAAFTAALALDTPWEKALQTAKGFVYGSLNESVRIGPGIEAMYPPATSYQGKTLLSKIEF